MGGKPHTRLSASAVRHRLLRGPRPHLFDGFPGLRHARGKGSPARFKSCAHSFQALSHSLNSSPTLLDSIINSCQFRFCCSDLRFKSFNRCSSRILSAFKSSVLEIISNAPNALQSSMFLCHSRPDMLEFGLRPG